MLYRQIDTPHTERGSIVSGVLLRKLASTISEDELIASQGRIQNLLEAEIRR